MNWCIVKYTIQKIYKMVIKLCSCIFYTKWLCSKLQISILTCILYNAMNTSMFMNTNEEVIAGDTDENAINPDAS